MLWAVTGRRALPRSRCLPGDSGPARGPARPALWQQGSLEKGFGKAPGPSPLGPEPRAEKDLVSGDPSETNCTPLLQEQKSFDLELISDEGHGKPKI